jgi:hypothetical protein
MIRNGKLILLSLAICMALTQGPIDLEIQGEKPVDINLDDIDISQAYYQEKELEVKQEAPKKGGKQQNEVPLQDLYYPDQFQAENTGGGGYPGMMPGRGMAGHPGMHGDGGYMADDIGRGHPGMNMGGHPGMMGNNMGHRGRGGHFDEMGGMPDMHGGRQGGHRSHQMGQNHQQQQFANNNNNNNNDPKSFMGKFSGFFSSTLYEVMMLIFVLGFVYNCVFGRTANDKFATAWYNANKKYFEDSYSQLAITKEKEEENLQQFGTPMM